MSRNVLLLFAFLSSFASLLIGINIGKRIAAPGQPDVLSSQADVSPTSQPTPTSQPAPSPSPTPAEITPTEKQLTGESVRNQNISIKTTNGVSVITDRTCGFSLSLPSSFIRQKTENGKSLIFADRENPDEAIATACAPDIPDPPVGEENQERLTLDGVTATLYHDRNPDDSPRNEVIIRNEENGLEIVIAGFGPSFQSAISSFTFLR